MRRGLPLAAGLLLCAAASAPLGAAADGGAGPDPSAGMRAAHEAYLAGDFAEAVRRYEAVAAAGLEGATLRYDLGNALFRAGQRGRAAASWERALRLDPSDAEARANLALVRRGHATRLPWARPAPVAERLAARFTDGEAALAFLLPWALLWALLAARLGARPSRRAPLAVGAGAAAVLALGGGLLSAEKAGELREPRAVVVSSGAGLVEAPSPSLAPTLELPEGAPVRALQAEGDWVRVRLPGGLEGWVRAADVERL